MVELSLSKCGDPSYESGRAAPNTDNGIAANNARIARRRITCDMWNIISSCLRSGPFPTRWHSPSGWFPDEVFHIHHGVPIALLRPARKQRGASHHGVMPRCRRESRRIGKPDKCCPVEPAVAPLTATNSPKRSIASGSRGCGTFMLQHRLGHRHDKPSG